MNVEVQLRVAGIRETSMVDGLGINYVIFLQGCSHVPKCKGCHNPSTHEFRNDCKIPLPILVNAIRNLPLVSGVTFSGGEPLDQYEAVVEMAKILKREYNYRLTLYTGYKIDEPECRYDLSMFDYVVDGRFVEAEKDVDCNLKGSKNQRILRANFKSPGLFTDINSGTKITQYISAAH